MHLSSLPRTHLALVVRHGFLILILHLVCFSHFSFLSSGFVSLLCMPFLSSCFFFVLSFLFVYTTQISVVPTLCSSS